MKILFVTRGFPSEEDIMWGNYEAVQAKALAAKGHQVSVVSVHFDSIRHIFRRTRIIHRVVDRVNVYGCTRILPSTRFLKLPKWNDRVVIRAYRQIVNRSIKDMGRPDVVHAHIVSCAAPLAFIIDEYHLPLVITEHWTAMNKEVIPDWLKKQSFIYHRADQVICVSQALADSLYRNFQVSSRVINNMVSNQFFLSKKANRCDGQFRFIACGAFRENRNKGFDILVDAFALAHFPENIQLNIIGDGPDRPFIEEKIANHGLSEQIHLLGVKTPDEVSEQLCLSDCFVLSSRLETFAIVVIEAMSKGLPVIATRSGGPETFLRPEHGLLVDKENVEQLSDAMKYMIWHNSDYDSYSIRKFCHSNFSQDIIADKIIEVYNNVINDKKVKA